MKILLIGEASFVHNTLKKGLIALGHQVTTMSAGNGWHDAPRDIDLRRNMRWGKLSGLKVVWQLLRHLRQLCGNDIVEIHNYQFVPLKYRWNTLLLRFLKLTNRCVVKGCFGDDPQIFRRQAMGIPTYSDTYWNGKPQNAELHRERIAEVMLHGAEQSWRKTTAMADALVACLYEYWLDYNEAPYARKLHYLPLPIEVPNPNNIRTKGQSYRIRVLVGIQPERDFMKGALRIASWLEDIKLRHSDRLEIRYVEGVPYDEYQRMLDEADVLVDQLYSYTPSMNSLAAMARGTVVIGGGETDYYDFIGEPTLRPIINVRPDVADSHNIEAIEKVLFAEGALERLSRESVEFVRKYHEVRHVAELYEQMYRELLTLHK